MRKIKSDVVIKKGENGWEAWQTNKLLYKTPGFDEESKEDVMRHIPGYENVIESSKGLNAIWKEGYDKWVPEFTCDDANPYEPGSTEWTVFMEGWYAAKSDKNCNSKQIKSSFYAKPYNELTFDESVNTINNISEYLYKIKRRDLSEKIHEDFRKLSGTSEEEYIRTANEWIRPNGYLDEELGISWRDEIESSRQITSAKSEEDFEQAVIEIADYFMVNADGNNIPLGREITDTDYLEGLDNICRRYNVSLRPSKNNSQTYTVINNSKQIKSSVSEILQDEEKTQYFSLTELERMNLNELQSGEITDDEFMKNDERINELYKKHLLNNSRQIASRFNQMDSFKQYSLSEVAQYLSALFFDLRTIHFLATGSEFYTYHKLAQELYEQTEDYYDDVAETAIGYDSNLQPMYVLPGDWGFVDENGSLNTDGQVPQTLILERLERIYDVLENVKEYDSMVASKLDAMKEYYDKEIYKLKQALK